MFRADFASIPPIYYTYSTINIINNNYSYVNMGANNANSVHGKSKIRKEFIIVPATATSKYKLQCNWCAEPPKSDNITKHQEPHLREYKAYKKAQNKLKGKAQ